MLQDHLLQTARKFIVLRNMEVNVIDPEVNCRFKDSTMTVTCVPLRLPSDSIMPVSYTHLDVYKRQPGKYTTY